VTVGEKLAGLVTVLLEQPPAGDAGVSAALKLVALARRFGLLRQVTAMLPPLEDEEAWHGLLARVAGVCLALPSDDVEIDADVAQREGADLVDALLGRQAGNRPGDVDLEPLHDGGQVVE
jgi:hypothetical protein